MTREEHQSLLNFILATLGYIPPKTDEELQAFEDLHKDYVPRNKDRHVDVNKIINGDVLTDAEILHPVFTALFAFPSCPPEIQVSVYQYILQTRAQQIYRTIPFDIIYDSYFIDGIISEEACSIGFSKEGKLSQIYDSNKYENFNCFKHPLIEILKQVSLKPKA